ncbi:MAG TPA: DNA polymerase III subunit gamma/tau [Candidatus Kapabacteria bacterium]|nr:DNA polymerase III subunit gamma/tau [Candidatus Kapabacteria bacterium]
MNANKEENFLVTARKFRPQNFADVVGQTHITNTLINAISTGRIHHAYLFCGPRGVGKTTTARILARAINCLNSKNSEPCNKCDNCIAILENKSLDVIEIDGASNNSVDDIRKLRENARYAPSSGKYKMYIIDEVHMLSNAAFNALLKILEEPPPHLIFTFATTEPHKVLATITSRCQRYDFKRMEISDIIAQLKYISEKENIYIDDESLIVIAKKGDGSMRDSQSIFDQVIAFCGKNVTIDNLSEALHLVDFDLFFDINNIIKTNNLKQLFEMTEAIQINGYDYGEIISGLIEFYRNIAALKTTNNPKVVELSYDQVEKIKNEIDYYSIEDIIKIINTLITLEHTIKNANQPRIKFELTIMQLASMAKIQDISKIIDLLKNISENPELKNFKFEITSNAKITPEAYQPKSIVAKTSITTKQANTSDALKSEVKVEIESKESNLPINNIENKPSNNVSSNIVAVNQDSSIEDLIIGLFGAKETKE